MATTLQPLAPLHHKNWSCVACLKRGQVWNPATHLGGKEQCTFHRSCYPYSASDLMGRCRRCGADLLKRVEHIASVADQYRMRDVARCFRVTHAQEEKGLPFGEDCRKNVTRSSSWHGQQKAQSDRSVRSNSL